MKIRILLLALLCGAAVAAATTWFPEEVKCPLCGETTEFQVVGSFGSYIYDWPSKFELIFWPTTESAFVYSCGNCHYTCFMYDFREPPADKLDALREAAAEVDFGGSYNAYTDIPMMDRLSAAEQIYRALGRDDEFWCRFYRIVGYHAAVEGLAEEAAAARGEALALAEAMAEDEARAGERKEFLLITGAMRYLRGDPDGARADFEAALPLTYENPAIEAERNEGYNDYLNSLLEEYLAKIGGSE